MFFFSGGSQNKCIYSFSGSLLLRSQFYVFTRELKAGSRVKATDLLYDLAALLPVPSAPGQQLCLWDRIDNSSLMFLTSCSGAPGRPAAGPAQPRSLVLGSRLKWGSWMFSPILPAKLEHLGVWCLAWFSSPQSLRGGPRNHPACPECEGHSAWRTRTAGAPSHVALALPREGGRGLLSSSCAGRHLPARSTPPLAAPGSAPPYHPRVGVRGAPRALPIPPSAPVHLGASLGFPALSSHPVPFLSILLAAGFVFLPPPSSRAAVAGGRPSFFSTCPFPALPPRSLRHPGWMDSHALSRPGTCTWWGHQGR